MTDPKAILREIKRCRERVNHYSPWKNEPAERKKLNSWKRRLKNALAAAVEAEIAVERDPYAPPPPPPPPPTEAELAEAELAEVKRRWIIPWEVGPKTRAWAPWGATGWSAVDIKATSRVWCRANRVDPRTGATVSTTAKVRRDRLIKRDPALKGKDRPPVRPEDAIPKPEPKIAVSADLPPEKARPAGTPEEEAAREAALLKIDEQFFGDDSLVDEGW